MGVSRVPLGVCRVLGRGMSGDGVGGSGGVGGAGGAVSLARVWSVSVVLVIFLWGSFGAGLRCARAAWCGAAACENGGRLLAVVRCV